MNNNFLSFKVSSGLKNLIGKELITNEFVAIFELVKNSFDAHAKNVKIIFENIYEANPSITIYDDGKGMNINDLEEKWLFVAYSAKKDNTEDNNESKDYRETITSNRGYAGAKGVGRFSCDRLASKLNLITIKNQKKSKIEKISVNWDLFEEDQKLEFFEVNVIHETLNSHAYPIKSGTILELKDLRDNWDREKILSLKKSLEKLINPNEHDKNFSIEIIVNEEIEKDSLKKNSYEKVNGFVENSIYSVLEVKTIKINTSITEDGKYLYTVLEDRGKMIYKLLEINPYPLLKDIKIEIFYLNRSAKVNFKRIMGIDSVSYGSIFLFKNGFRLFPIGEAGDDPFSIDKRKTQGYARFLGTREIIGRIEISKNNEELKETTSRDGGLIRNDHYLMLERFFYDQALKRLEKYIVDIIRWGEPINKDGVERPALNPEDVKKEILDFIQKISKAKDFVEIEYDKDFFKIIEERQEKSFSKQITNLARTALNSTDNKELHEGIGKIGSQFNTLLKEKSNYENEIDVKAAEIDQKNEEIRHAKFDLEKTSNQNLFLKSVSSLDKDNIISLHHQIGIYASDIDAKLVIWNRRISNGKKFEINEVKKLLDSIEFLNKKIMSVVKFATKANFNLQSEKIEADLVVFVQDYINNIVNVIDDRSLNFKIKNKSNEAFITKFKPIEMSIVIDNIISNAKKFKASKIDIEFIVTENTLIMNLVDDGKGLNNNIKDTNKVFEKGFTTTSGSGLGLFHSKQIIRELNGDISIIQNISSGMGLKIEVSK